MKLHSPLPVKKTRLEIIPLIDVMFFLLASFMMVSLTMTKQQTIGVNLPVATTSQNDFKPDMINLGVSAVGDVFIDKNPVTLPDLQKQLPQSRHPRLHQWRRRHPPRRHGPHPR
jgi:biopolymer transport protein ExbD